MEIKRKATPRSNKAGATAETEENKIDIDSLDILKMLNEDEESGLYDPKIFQVKLVAIQDEWRKSKATKKGVDADVKSKDEEKPADGPSGSNAVGDGTVTGELN